MYLPICADVRVKLELVALRITLQPLGLAEADPLLVQAYQV
jgi:hypothetical protein